MTTFITGRPAAGPDPEPAGPADPDSANETEPTRSEVLRSIAHRVLWLATAIVDAANRGRPNTTGIKVGGHQASSASMVVC